MVTARRKLQALDHQKSYKETIAYKTLGVSYLPSLTDYSLKINVNIAFSMQFLLELDYFYLMYTMRGILRGNLYFLN